MHNDIKPLVWVLLASWTLAPIFGHRTATQSIPTRIVSLVPAVTEMLFAIGAGAAVVGVSNFDHFPPEVESRTTVGALIDPDVEAILSLKPDLVVIYQSQDELRSQLGRARIDTFPYLHYVGGGLSGVTRNIREVGRRVGREGAADAVAADIERRLDAIRGRVAGRPRPRTLLVFGRDRGSLRGIQASGGLGFLHDMLTTAGGDNVLADVQREGLQITTEVILAHAPDVILDIRPASSGTPAEADTDEDPAWSRLASVPAVKNHRIYRLVGDELVIPGPRVAAGTERFARALHPDAF